MRIIVLFGFSGSMKSFLKKILPTFLYNDLFPDGEAGPGQPRQFNIGVHWVTGGDSLVQAISSNISKHDRKYLAIWKDLTFRQQEVLALACLGHRDHEIMNVLSIELGTVKGHWQLIFKKFLVRDRNEIRRALRDWDFTEWWDHRHMQPRPLPHISTGGQTSRLLS